MWAGGVEETEELVRADAGVARLWNGDLPRQDDGSLVTLREGMKMSVGSDGRRIVEATRTISRDSY